MTLGKPQGSGKGRGGYEECEIMAAQTTIDYDNCAIELGKEEIGLLGICLGFVSTMVRQESGGNQRGRWGQDA